jgi:hypothetical protein
MALPVKFSKVHYYLISRQYSFAGDLVIAHKILYFFPQLDLETQRMRRVQWSIWGGLANVAAATVDSVVDAAEGSYLSKNGLWHDGITDEQFRQKADVHIAELREKRKSERFSESLPIPIRIALDEITNLKLSITGKLSFVAQSDNQDFNTGWRRKRALRDALREGAFI